jgi:hypothetical protein
MIFIWGTKSSFPMKGYAASFCPFCRDLRQFKVKEIRRVSHVYYIPLGRGKLVGYRFECLECGVPLTMDEAPIESVAPTPSTTVDASIAETNPGLPSAYEKRLALEREIRSGSPPTDPEIRRGLLFEPFEALSPEMERGCTETRIDWPGALGCFGTIGAIVVSIFAASFLAEVIWGEQASPEMIIFVMIGVGLVGLVYTMWQLHLSARRWLERRHVPHLKLALAPLRPTDEEIDEIIDAYRYHGMRFAKQLRPSVLRSDPQVLAPPTDQSAQPLVPK